MSILTEFVTSYFFIAVGSAWITSVLLKWMFNPLRGKSGKIAFAFANGGMPSSHSALVASTSAAIYLIEGFSSTFFLSVLLALIVMSDSFKVRRNLGEQGDSLNLLLIKLKQNPIIVVHGHSLFQVIIGALWGIAISILTYGMMF